ncbi:uncharacterized protein LOC112575449 isoform X2 [Pomacea canaliculata]|uniref:uncharacterized protein LOC112575449 isoform X2 n=1 Tax=Pomacea canaliculata TaxID=400727 RepID=UPI000D734BB5|nr:uncharacterized protein LOC112575449 isoform X2 [Pomacea canaliculata]
MTTMSCLRLGNLTTDLPEGTASGTDDSQTTLLEAETAQRMYQKAVELLERVRTLQEIPSNLQSQYSQLEELGKEMTKAINELKDSSNYFTKNIKKKK